MNKTLHEEELDRELILNSPKSSHDGSTFNWTMNKVKVSKKNLVFENGSGKKFRFSKRRFIGNGLEIAVMWERQRLERCSLGHDHRVGNKEFTEESGTLSWEYVEQLIEWLNDGTFQQVTNKTPGWVNVFVEINDLLKMVESSNKILAAACQKLRAKMKYQLGEEGFSNALEEKNEVRKK